MREPHVVTGYRFAPVPEAVIYDRDLDATAVRVYAALMRHGLDPSSCYPSHQRLAELCRLSPRSVQHPLRVLEGAGWIRRVPRFTDRGDRTTDGFEVFIEKQTGAHRNAPPAQTCAVPRVPVRVPPAHQNADKNNENKENESQENELTLELVVSVPPEVEPGSDADPLFVEFWTTYPRKVGIGAARVAWRKAIVTKQIAPDLIITAAQAFAARRASEDPKFTPHASTWLNQERWLDLPDEEEPMVSRSYRNLEAWAAK